MSRRRTNNKLEMLIAELMADNIYLPVSEATLKAEQMLKDRRREKLDRRRLKKEQKQ